MTLFTNKYRVESSKLKGWDYTNSGVYYLTICTKDMIKYFGKIKHGKVLYSKEGEIINEKWNLTAYVRKNVILDEYIVMPNHFHAVIFIEKDNLKFPQKTSFETAQRAVSTDSRTLKSQTLLVQLLDNLNQNAQGEFANLIIILTGSPDFMKGYYETKKNLLQ